jgi:hypothetical protein
VDNSSTGLGPATVVVNTDPDGLGPAGFGPAVTASATNVGAVFPVTPQPGPFRQGGRTTDAEPKVAWDRSGGPHNGRVYLVYTDSPTVATDPSTPVSPTNIFLRFSDNNGAAWSPPVQVNDDTSGNTHFLPYVAVDPTNGSVGVSWYDCRNDTGSGPDDRDGKPDTDAEVYATASFDGGQTFVPNLKVANGPSNSVTLNPVPLGGSNGPFNFGDYTGLDYNGGILHPVWADNSTSLPGGNSPMFSMATASVPVSAPAPVLAEDPFEPNDTSDKATNFGPLTGSQTYKALTINKHANGLPDYDWFRWSAGAAGTFSASIAATNGNLELHLFTLSGNTLVELAKDTIKGQANKGVTAAVTSGETLLVEVKGIELSLGVFGQATYDLGVGIA